VVRTGNRRKKILKHLSRNRIRTLSTDENGETERMIKKKVPIKEIDSDVFPTLCKEILENVFKTKSKIWGERYTQSITKPMTNEDLLFGYLNDLDETSLRMQALIMGKEISIQNDKIEIGRIHDPKVQNQIMKEIDDRATQEDDYRSDLYKTYINNLKREVGLIISTLQDMGYDMETPPE
jgi:hypothetical protein